MAVDMFLKLDGIKGEMGDGSVRVESFSFGASNPGAANQRGGGAGAGRVVTDIVITKVLDSASPALLAACASGRHIASAELVTPAGATEVREAAFLKLTNVLVSSVRFAGNAHGGQVPTEEVSLNFLKFEFRVGQVAGIG